jgi:2'-deoxynucleoside 5'-phosphate N-hydrolase
MNIYFSCSITGGRSDQAVYQAVVDLLLEKGHTVPTAHLARPDVLEDEKVIGAAEVYERDVKWVGECDAVVAEVSTPSHGVGYEIALACFLNKPVLCCYHRDRRVSKMILGNSHPGLRTAAYSTVAEACALVEAFLAGLPAGS